VPLKLYDKGKILDSCFEIFVKNGYSNTTTAMLSEAAGISKALLFHHFKSKKRIYIRILDRCFEKMSEEIEEESLSDFNDFFEAKGQSGLNKIDYLRQNPDISKILYEAYVSTPDELRDEVNKFIIHIKNKYGSIEESKNKLIKELFDDIPLRDGVNNEQAFELVNIVMDHFRKSIATELTDEKKILDDEYWENLFIRKRKFLDMIRYGIERKGGQV
jgi:AcrR family transcriptional regulator